MAPKPRTVKEIFKDYRGRRTALINALTRDADQVYDLCDPEKENLCLYGHSDESWEVCLPEEQVPTDIPEPALGINFGREGINRSDWFRMVAMHSDSWLVCVAYYFGFSLNSNERAQLFNLMNNLPNISEVVANWKPDGDKSTKNSGNNSRGNTQVSVFL
uniref:PHD finger protein ALFIN-LIKE n=1 Tax=Cajanus cajan TaxID=3821 RepID=A0A151QTJ5_CAJCA|nr:PHD finger protein At5g26210 family [Cajanus cajan]